MCTERGERGERREESAHAASKNNNPKGKPHQKGILILSRLRISLSERSHLYYSFYSSSYYSDDNIIIMHFHK